MVFLAVISVDRIDTARVERNSAFVQDWWERYDACWWSIDPVVRTDPVYSNEPCNDQNLVDAHCRGRPIYSISRADAALERSTCSPGLVEAEGCVCEVDEVVCKVARISRPCVESEITCTPEVRVKWRGCWRESPTKPG